MEIDLTDEMDNVFFGVWRNLGFFSVRSLYRYIVFGGVIRRKR